MAETFRYRIYTPEKIFQDDVTESLVLQGLDGQLCVQAHHMSALFALDTGLIRVKKDGVWRQFVSTEGFVDVNYNRAYIYVDFCLEEEDAEKAAEELTRLKARERGVLDQADENARRMIRSLITGLVDSSYSIRFAVTE